ncbi:MAG: 5'-methylthioadenosine/adenosylhomocysteine nucleosidase [SAR324 cluster bacterium]|nr:5'-methylthioadenosine/adenosylhomocysteine nucleosidase [SAR324 cluster bacterium]MBL7034906.1 5'-methylthioadenosine/adenosylhomocysteine nucleosidase [SAR324 cluster bacterium]
MRIGILCAIPKEIEHFDLLADSGQKLGGRTFFKSQHSLHQLIVVECGLGKVNAALASTLLIQVFECELLIFSGVAGGLDPQMKIGEVIVAESLIQYDYGALNDKELTVYRAGNIPMGCPKNGPEFLLNQEIKAIITAALPDVKLGRILTGDIFLQCEKTRELLFEKWDAQAVEMEGGAIAQVAEQFGISTLVVRCLSDLAGANGEKLNSNFLKNAAETSYQTVQRILAVIF